MVSEVDSKLYSQERGAGLVYDQHICHNICGI